MASNDFVHGDWSNKSKSLKFLKITSSFFFLIIIKTLHINTEFRVQLHKAYRNGTFGSIIFAGMPIRLKVYWLLAHLWFFQSFCRAEKFLPHHLLSDECYFNDTSSKVPGCKVFEVAMGGIGLKRLRVMQVYPTTWSVHFVEIITKVLNKYVPLKVWA